MWAKGKPSQTSCLFVFRLFFRLNARSAGILMITAQTIFGRQNSMRRLPPTFETQFEGWSRIIGSGLSMPVATRRNTLRLESEFFIRCQPGTLTASLFGNEPRDCCPVFA